MSESRCSFNPFSCSKCGTDYTPVWKREKTGSPNVVCEACLASTQRLGLKNEYEDAVDKGMQQHYTAERDLDREYQEIISTPSKLDAYIKEQEKKLLASQQLQFAQQAVYNQRYNAKASANAAASVLRQSPSTVVGGTSVAAAAHQRSRVAATAGSTAAAASVAVPAAIASTSAAQMAAATQMALQYAKVMSGAASGGANSPAALMISALANSQQQQQAVAALQQQQQQRLVAAQLLSGLQQQPQVAAPSAPDQTATTLTQLQALLVSNCLLNGGGVQNANARAQLLQTMQYLLMQQQQQQAQQAAAQAAAAQQGAALSHFIAQIQNNPASYLNFVQHLWPNANLSGGSSGGSGTGGSNQPVTSPTKK